MMRAQGLPAPAVRRLGRSAGCLFALLATAACSNKAENPNPFPAPTGAGASSGKGNGSEPSGMVSVTINAPTAGAVVNAGSVFDVQAAVTIVNGTDFVDATAVKATFTAKGASDMLASSPLTDTGTTFVGKVSVGQVAPGTYTLTVTAAGSGGQVGTASVDLQVDGGPTLMVTAPKPNAHLRGTATIEVVAADDAGLKSLTATIADMPVDLAPLTDPANTFRGSFDLNGPNPPLAGQQILIVTAISNDGRQVEQRVLFEVDDDGPQITMTTPTPGEIVGNVILLSANVSDGAGVLDSSVIAVIGDDTTPRFEIPLAPDGTGAYSAYFDTARLTACPDPPSQALCIVFPTISFRASDLLGNETVLGYGFAVDNVAPIADLDPPDIRDSKLDSVLRCSWTFDPLDPDHNVGDMPNDAKVVPQVFDLRARVEDDSNRALGLKLGPISGVDPGATSVYILDDQTQALVVDTDGNGTCDSINPLLTPTTQPPTMNNQVLKIRLSPVPKAGNADFTPDSSLPDVAWGTCQPGIDPSRPGPICQFGGQPTIAISYAFGESAIWSVDPIDQSHCFGNQFDTLANNIGEGWACVAVGTRDQTGNYSVSAPLRIYIKYNGVTAFGLDPPASAGPPPACTGIYDRGTNTVTAGGCTTRKFPAGEICFEGDCH